MLGTRVVRVLDQLGVETLEQFAAVKRSDFMAVRGAGVRSWSEVERVQSRLRGVSRGGRDNAKALAAALNETLREDPRLVAVVVNGRIRIAEML